MSVTVKIPTPLRRLTNNKDKVNADGGNLQSVIDSLEGEFPGIKERLCDETGSLRHFVNIYLNGEDVRYLDGLNTETKTGDEVSIVPAVAGGC
ncbi:MAG: ubiquitin-like small modifier protein 1 [Dehalococcoidia bacterium]